MIVVDDNYFDKMVVEGFAQLHHLKVENQPDFNQTYKVIHEFYQHHFCCSGYQYVFLQFWSNSDFSAIYKINQLRKQGKINEKLKLVWMHEGISHQSQTDLKELGIDGFLQKPIKYDEFKKVIEE